MQVLCFWKIIVGTAAALAIVSYDLFLSADREVGVETLTEAYAYYAWTTAGAHLEVGRFAVLHVRQG